MIENAREQRCNDPDVFCDGMSKLVNEALGAKLKLEKVSAGEILTRAFALVGCLQVICVYVHTSYVCVMFVHTHEKGCIGRAAPAHQELVDLFVLGCFFNNECCEQCWHCVCDRHPYSLLRHSF
jgi:hypothetical protein